MDNLRDKGGIMGKLRPQYHYFKGYSRAKEFADKLNSKARVNQWLVRANGEGYTVYNLRSDVSPMITESYGESGTIQEFQDRMNQEVRF